jgi:hypothetical protein
MGLTGEPVAPDDGLDGWIRGLRDHLARGDLVTLKPFDLGYGTMQLPGETTLRIMLADLSDLDDPLGSWGGDAAWRDERRHRLRDDFTRLRALLG